MRLLLWFAGPSFFLSSGDRIAGEVPELQQKCEGPFRSFRRIVRFARMCLSVKGKIITQICQNYVLKYIKIISQ